MNPEQIIALLAVIADLKIALDEQARRADRAEKRLADIEQVDA